MKLLNNFQAIIREETKEFAPAQARHFAWLCAVRALPFLGIRMRFRYWKRNERQEHLFSIFWTLDVVRLMTLEDAKLNPDEASDVARSAVSAAAIAANATKNLTITNTASAIANAANVVVDETNTIENVYAAAIKTANASIYAARSATPRFSLSSFLDFFLSLIFILSISFFVFVFSAYILEQFTNMTHTHALMLAFIPVTIILVIILVVCWVRERQQTTNFSRIILNDVEAIKTGKLDNISYDTKMYGKTWRKFIRSLTKTKCNYWAEIYEHLFENQFTMDTDELWRRIEVPRRIQAKGAAHVGQYMVEQRKQREYEARRRERKVVSPN